GRAGTRARAAPRGRGRRDRPTPRGGSSPPAGAPRSARRGAAAPAPGSSLPPTVARVGGEGRAGPAGGAPWAGTLPGVEPARVPLDPFGLTPDTAAYVPRPATERVIAELLEGLHHGAEPVALLGPAGSGKTLLLHLLAERARPALQGVYLPNPRLGPEELCTWVLRGLGAAVEEDPVWLLRAAVAHLRERGEGCLLLIDDAHRLSDAAA